MTRPPNRGGGRPGGFVAPGLGLVLGTGIGAVVGLLADPEVFVLYAGAGSGIGLVIGAAVASYRR